MFFFKFSGNMGFKCKLQNDRNSMNSEEILQRQTYKSFKSKCSKKSPICKIYKSYIGISFQCLNLLQFHFKIKNVHSVDQAYYYEPSAPNSQSVTENVIFGNEQPSLNIKKSKFCWVKKSLYLYAASSVILALCYLIRTSSAAGETAFHPV